MSLSQSVILEAKNRINCYDLVGLQELFSDVHDTSDLDWPTIFLKVYLHACLKKQGEIKEWLEQMFETFDPIVKIGLRQTFLYGNWLYRQTDGSADNTADRWLSR
jgi:hypothetical protein